MDEDESFPYEDGLEFAMIISNDKIQFCRRSRSWLYFTPSWNNFHCFALHKRCL